jgi:acetyl esterase/lipase
LQVYAVEYRSAPEFRDPVQLDECSAVIDWVQGEGGRERGVHPDRVAVGGDCAGANLTAAICLRRLCQRAKPPVAAQVLLYPATGLPSDAPAAASGRDLQCKGVTEFANYYFPRPKGEPFFHLANPSSSTNRHPTNIPEQAQHRTGVMRTSPPACKDVLISVNCPPLSSVRAGSVHYETPTVST